MAKKEAEEKPKIDFKDISKRLANIKHRQHVDQIGASLTEAYIKNAKFTDQKGVVRYKTEFTDEEAEKLGNDVYDSLVYHVHKRYFDIDEDKYKRLLDIKDPNGIPYADSIVQFHMDVDRQGLKKSLKKHEKIEAGTIANLLEENIGRHVGKIRTGITKDLQDPENMNRLKEAIEHIKAEHGIAKKKYDTSKMHDPREVLETYIALSGRYYAESE
jgi:hypothetical protein